MSDARLVHFPNCAKTFRTRASPKCASEKHLPKSARLAFWTCILFQNCATDISVVQYKLSSLAESGINMLDVKVEFDFVAA